MKIPLQNYLSKLDSYPELKLGTSIVKGIEKEALRITPEGYLSQTFHPRALGSKLTHPYITTDYSEALLEFIAPPDTEIDNVLRFTNQLQAFTYQKLQDEVLWAASMPCFLTSENDIPIADYGCSNVGRMKTIYRRGLEHRYGKRMQTIAGLHYNCSFPVAFWQAMAEIEQPTLPFRQYQDEKGMGLVRNFLRYSWFVIALFGASPAVCRSFDPDNRLKLNTIGEKSLYGRWATALRMSDAGYQNSAQAQLAISYNTLSEYVEGLLQATQTPEEKFKVFSPPTFRPHQQLSANQLQIEAEFYASIRPKQTTYSGERPVHALLERGIQYFELRAIDLNPYAVAGITAEQSALLDCLLLYCAFTDSPPLSEKEVALNRYNQDQAVLQGRNPQTCIQSISGQETKLIDTIQLLFEQLSTIAVFLDKDRADGFYTRALQQQQSQAQTQESWLSSQILRTIESDYDGCYFDFAMAESRKRQLELQADAMPADVEKKLEKLAEESLHNQHQIEQQDTQPLDDFIQDYFST